jgi:hypothetical protein
MVWAVFVYAGPQAGGAAQNDTIEVWHHRVRNHIFLPPFF